MRFHTILRGEGQNGRSCGVLMSRRQTMLCRGGIVDATAMPLLGVPADRHFAVIMSFPATGSRRAPLPPSARQGG